MSSVHRAHRMEGETAPRASGEGAAADTGESPDPIDRAHLSRYTLGSPRLDREILGLFIAQLPLSIEQLRFAATDREWQVAAHTIKGSARAVGAWQVSRLAREAESIPGVADPDAGTRILAELDAACEAVQAYVAASFPGEPPLAEG